MGTQCQQMPGGGSKNILLVRLCGPFEHIAKKYHCCPRSWPTTSDASTYCFGLTVSQPDVKLVPHYYMLGGPRSLTRMKIGAAASQSGEFPAGTSISEPIFKGVT